MGHPASQFKTLRYAALIAAGIIMFGLTKGMAGIAISVETPVITPARSSLNLNAFSLPPHATIGYEVMIEGSVIDFDVSATTSGKTTRTAETLWRHHCITHAKKSKHGSTRWRFISALV